MIRILSLAVLLVLTVAATDRARADELSMKLGAAKSTRLSALLDEILPIFKTASNLTVQVVAIDRGRESDASEHIDASALLLDSRAVEDKIIADHYAVGGREAFYDDYLIVGPKSDPASIRQLADAKKAFAQIAAKGAAFVSRGDDGRAYRRETRLWTSAGVKPGKADSWYRETKQGMAATLAAAAASDSYTLTDRASWATFHDRRNLDIMVQNDPVLLNVYSDFLVDPKKQSHTPFIYARIWHDWITDKHGSAAIVSFKIGGEQIFFPCQGDALKLCQSAVEQSAAKQSAVGKSAPEKSK